MWILLIFCLWFSRPHCSLLPDQNLLIPSHQNVLIFFKSNIYNGNIEIFWYRKLCMRTWYTSKSCEYCWFFLYDFWAKNVPIPQLTYYWQYMGKNWGLPRADLVWNSWKFSGQKLIKRQWLTSGEWDGSLDNGPKLAVEKQNNRQKSDVQILT